MSMKNITLEINGEKRSIPPVSNVYELLDHLGIDASRIAVEVNRKIILRNEWSSTPVRANDCIEIVQFVGGG
jgi:thiamine biosynthesis protein ThiS